MKMAHKHFDRCSLMSYRRSATPLRRMKFSFAAAAASRPSRDHQPKLEPTPTFNTSSHGSISLSRRSLRHRRGISMPLDGGEADITLVSAKSEESIGQFGAATDQRIGTVTPQT